MGNARFWQTGMLLVVLAIALEQSGCCNCNPPLIDRSKLPQPLSLAEQVSLLDARTHAVPRLRAKTVIRGVELTYKDKDKQLHTQNVEGTLLMRQDAAGNADVMLLGTAFDQQVFQAGRNATDWWFILRVDPKTAWTGDSRKPIDWERLSTPTGGATTGILRADLVQDLIGLRVLGAPKSDESLLLRVDDDSATNVVLIENMNPAMGRLWIKRELTIDRFSGDIKEVRLYNPDGIMIVRSTMTDYRPVTYTGDKNDAALKVPPRMPYKVLLDYPAQEMRVSLTFDTVAIPDKINDVAFETPDFADEGLKVNRE